MAKKHARVYHGRLKGTTETHLPNDEFRYKYGETFSCSDNWVEERCIACGQTDRVHKLELKIHRCSNCGE